MPRLQVKSCCRPFGFLTTRAFPEFMAACDRWNNSHAAVNCTLATQRWWMRYVPIVWLLGDSLWGNSRCVDNADLRSGPRRTHLLHTTGEEPPLPARSVDKQLLPASVKALDPFFRGSAAQTLDCFEFESNLFNVSTKKDLCDLRLARARYDGEYLRCYHMHLGGYENHREAGHEKGRRRVGKEDINLLDTD